MTKPVNTAQQVRIGTSDLQIHPFNLGGNSFGMTNDAAESEQVLDAFVAAGGNFIDTADMYSFFFPGNSGGESETIIGEWMAKRGNRSEVVVATKMAGLPELKGLAPQTIATAAENSLQRLQSDYIDLYYAHYEDPDTPIADSARAFDELVKAGKVRQIALSNFSPAAVEEWMTVAKENGYAQPVALQPQYSLVHRRDFEQDHAAVAEKHQLSVFPYFSLAAGFLSGKYRSEADAEGRARGSAVRDYLNEDGYRVLEVLDQVAAAHGSTPSAVSLAWLLAQPGVTAPLASATSVDQLHELLSANELTLGADELAQLTEVSQPYA